MAKEGIAPVYSAVCTKGKIYRTFHHISIYVCFIVNHENIFVLAEVASCYSPVIIDWLCLTDWGSLALQEVFYNDPSPCDSGAPPYGKYIE